MDQQVDQLAASLFQKVTPREPVHVPFTADDVINEGKKHHWQFRLMEYRGTIDAPFADEQFEYCDFKALQDQYTLPGWANKRLRLVRSKFPVKQIIIGHEKENPLDEVEMRARRQAEKAERALRKAAVVVATIIGVVAIAGATLALLLVGGAVLALGAILAAPAALLDPLVIVVLDDEEESWVCIARYLE